MPVTIISHPDCAAHNMGKFHPESSALTTRNNICCSFAVFIHCVRISYTTIPSDERMIAGAQIFN